MSNKCAAMGRKLTRARRRHQLSQNDVSQELCISLYQLKALESGRLDQLPGSVYALGFIRNYADLVELEPAELIALAKDCLAEEECARNPHMPEPHRESRFPARLLLVGTTSAMLLFFTAWPMIGSETGSEASIVPMLPVHLATRLEDATASDPNAAQTDVERPVAGQELFLGQEIMPNTPAEAVPDAEEGKGATPEAGLMGEEEIIAAATVEIRATHDTWVEITDEKNQKLLSGIIRSGDSFIPESTAQLKLTASDGGNLVLYVRGQPVSELGTPGHELHAYKLDVAGIIKGAS